MSVGRPARTENYGPHHVHPAGVVPEEDRVRPFARERVSDVGKLVDNPRHLSLRGLSRRAADVGCHLSLVPFLFDNLARTKDQRLHYRLVELLQIQVKSFILPCFLLFNVGDVEVLPLLKHMLDLLIDLLKFFNEGCGDANLLVFFLSFLLLLRYLLLSFFSFPCNFNLLRC